MSIQGRANQAEKVKGRAMGEQVRVGERVRVEGRDEVFVVLRIDREQQLADLLRHGKVHKIESGVPLALLRPVWEPEAAGDLGISA